MRITVTGQKSASLETEHPKFSDLAALAVVAQSRLAPVVVFAWDSLELAVTSVNALQDLDKITAALAVLPAEENAVRGQLFFAHAVLTGYAFGVLPAWA